MVDMITRVRVASPSLGQGAALRKEKRKHGKDDPPRDQDTRPHNQTFSSMSDGSPEKHEKGNLIDIRV